MDIDWLKSIVEEDSQGLLHLESDSSPLTGDELLISKFLEISDFVSKHSREPLPDMANVPEYMLYQRLNAIRQNTDQCCLLVDFDIHDLLNQAVPEPKKEIETLGDIFDDDDLGLLGDSEESIFNIEHVPKNICMPETVARRKPCKEFSRFEPLFKSCHQQVKAGERELRRFEGEQQIDEGNFFILNGVMCYVAQKGEREKRSGKYDHRLHLIFENGTESRMLMRSLARELYKRDNGKRVLDSRELALDDLAGVGQEDQATGYIYILKSLSEVPEISQISNLYKIGYSTTPVEERIANAKNETTYLMAPVEIVSIYQCFNMNAQKFENLAHKFFGHTCLDVEVADSGGISRKPREWFIAPVEAIELAVKLLVNGEIVHYRYDKSSEEIVLNG